MTTFFTVEHLDSPRTWHVVGGKYRGERAAVNAAFDQARVEPGDGTPRVRVIRTREGCRTVRIAIEGLKDRVLDFTTGESREVYA